MKKKQKHEPKIQPDSAIWKYRLSSKTCAIFSATAPERRWSFDGKPLKDSSGSQKPRETRLDRLQPVYPVLKEDEGTRLNALPGMVIPKCYWYSGRWFYLTEGKNLHVFHNISTDRRNSLSDLDSFQRSKALKPHPARPLTLLPLSQKQKYEENESKRTHWYWDQLLKLGKAWGSKKRKHKNRLQRPQNLETLDGDSDREACFWLPDDVDSESFISISMAASDANMDRGKPRRWSFDEKDIAYTDLENPPLPYPFLIDRDEQSPPVRFDRFRAGPGAYFPRTDSRSTSPTSARSSFIYVRRDSPRTNRTASPRRRRSMSSVRPAFGERTSTRSPSPYAFPPPSHKRRQPQQTHTWRKVLGMVVKTFVCVFNTLFLCAPVTALIRILRKYYTTRSRSKRFPRKPSHIRKYPPNQRVMFQYSSRSSRRRTRCWACDLDFSIKDRRRRWTALTAEAPRNRSRERAQASYVFSWRYTRDVVWGLVRKWMDDKGWRERMRTFMRYEFGAAMKKEEENDEEKGRGRRIGDGKAGPQERRGENFRGWVRSDLK
jgi:hypothetical protein